MRSPVGELKQTAAVIRSPVRLGTVILVVGLSCYDTTATRMLVRTPFSQLDCVATADRVFEREGLVAASGVTGTNRLYSPRIAPGQSLTLRWGIAVDIDRAPGGDGDGQCIFDLQALSADEGCGINCPLTPHGGSGLNDFTRRMAAALSQAFGGPNGAQMASRPSSASVGQLPGLPAFGLAQVNSAADPCRDFAAYACGAEGKGGTLRSGSDPLAWRTAAVWRFLDELAAGKHQDGRPATALMKDFYARCRDPHAHEAGMADVQVDLTRIERAGTLADLAKMLGELRASGMSILIGFMPALADRPADPTSFVSRFDLNRSWLSVRKGAHDPSPAEALHRHWQRLVGMTPGMSAGEIDAALGVAMSLDHPAMPSGAFATRPHPIDRRALYAYRFPWAQYLDGLGLPRRCP